MTKATKADRTRRARQTGLGALALGLVCTLLAGCTNSTLLTQFVAPWKMDAPEAKTPSSSGPKDDLVLKNGGLQKAAAYWDPRQEDLEAGKRLVEQKKFPEAEKAFHKLANGKKCPEQIREEALFFEAECLRLQHKLRDSEETYALLFKDFPSTQFTERADRGLFEIALRWLEGTRSQMEAYEEQRQGKRWVVMPIAFVHFSQEMPVFDPEGHAVRVLEGIQMREKVLHTPLGEQALLYLGTIKMYREDYLGADNDFTELYRHYPNSKNAARAIKQSVICKQLCTCGTCYDLRTVEESRKLIHTAQTAYAEFGKDKEWIGQQLVGINLQQADRDWRIAEFYRWTKHPGPAYFYYELVRRCYPNTEYAAKANDRIHELEQKHGPALRSAAPGASPPGAAPPGAALPGAALPGTPTAATPTPGAATPGTPAPAAPSPPTLAPPRSLPPSLTPPPP